MKKLLTIIIFFFIALSSSSSQAKFSNQSISNSQNFLQSADLTNLFSISGSKFFISIDTSTPREVIPSYEIVQPKSTLTTSPSPAPSSQGVWVINNNWQKTPAHQGNSFITLTPIQ